jgi:hypothetical protein
VTRTRRRSGCLPFLLGLLVFLAIVAVIADRVAAGVAERRIAGLVREEAQRNKVTPGSVEATVNGFPFLTQAIRGEFEGGDLTLDDVKVDGAAVGAGPVKAITLRRIDVHVTGLSVPRDVLTGATPHDVIAKQLTGKATATMDQFAAALPIPGLRLTGSGETVQFSAPIPLAGLALRVTGTAQLQLRGNRVSLKVQKIEAGGVQAPQQVVDRVAAQFNTGAELPPLPLKLKVTSVRLDGSVVSVAAAAQNVDLAARS